MSNTEVTIIQAPVKVDYTCPWCDEDITQYFDDFLDDQGLLWSDFPDWQYEYITCPECGKKIDDVSYEFD